MQTSQTFLLRTREKNNEERLITTLKPNSTTMYCCLSMKPGIYRSLNVSSSVSLAPQKQIKKEKKNIDT